MHQGLGGNYVTRRKVVCFEGETHVSNAVIGCNAPGLGYCSMKSDELISSASRVGNDEHFISGFPRRRPVASRRLDFCDAIDWSDTGGV